MSLTTDPNDPRIGRGVDSEPTPQHEVYLVLSEEERRKGFVRPLRNKYIHVGKRPKYPLTDLTPEEHERYRNVGYVKFEKYPEESGKLGRYWTQKQLDSKGCGVETVMGNALSETWARDIYFYGATYCVGCQKHLPVDEFVWSADGDVVGS